jgi:hypothetical protein
MRQGNQEPGLSRNASDLLLPRNMAEFVGRDGALRPIVNIVNRPLGSFAPSQAGRLTIGRRMPSCPTEQRSLNQNAACWRFFSQV